MKGEEEEKPSFPSSLFPTYKSPLLLTQLGKGGGRRQFGTLPTPNFRQVFVRQNSHDLFRPKHDGAAKCNVDLFDFFQRGFFPATSVSATVLSRYRLTPENKDQKSHMLIGSYVTVVCFSLAACFNGKKVFFVKVKRSQDHSKTAKRFFLSLHHPLRGLLRSWEEKEKKKKREGGISWAHTKKKRGNLADFFLLGFLPSCHRGTTADTRSVNMFSFSFHSISECFLFLRQSNRMCSVTVQ